MARLLKLFFEMALMKYFYFFSVFFFINFHAQEIKKDIFNNYEFCRKDKKFCANLKKDIFDNIIYTDDKKNTITYNRKYVAKYFPELFKNESITVDFFAGLLEEFKYYKNYSRTHEIDIFDKEIVEDNRHFKSVYYKDIHGKYQYEENFNNSKTTLSEDFNGNIVYKNGNIWAKLEKNFQGNWKFSDKSGTNMEFSKETWNLLLQKFGDKSKIANYLISTFL